MFATAWSGATRDWPVRKAQLGELALIAVVELTAAISIVVTLATDHSAARGWGEAGLLMLLVVLFDEGSRRAARLQIRLSTPFRVDLTSVWAVAAAVALSPLQATAVVLAYSLHAWFRHQRPAHEPMYRKSYVCATMILGCLSAGLASRGLGGVAAGQPWELRSLGSVLVAMVAYTTINRALVSTLLVVVGARIRDLAGTVHENLIEVATLCLGGLVALALVFAPWLTVLVLAPMITLQRGALVRDLEVAATTDAKTGLLNAVAWEQVAQREVARAVRQREGLAVFIVDIDHFKLVNDHYGHLIGDDVLSSVAGRLAAALREYDTLGRFGGEEFVAVLPDVSAGAALDIAERLRAEVNAKTVGQIAPHAGSDADLRLAVSVGVACLGMHGDDLSDLLRSADGALYVAKAAGRNRVVLAQTGTDPAPILG